MLRYKFVIIGLILGTVGGFLYWKYIGCMSGTCPLTSNWLIMIIYGALLGTTLGSIFIKNNKD